MLLCPPLRPRTGRTPAALKQVWVMVADIVAEGIAGIATPVS
jgi:hypothetical protein